MRMFRRFTSANSFKPEVEETLRERKGSRRDTKEKKKRSFTIVVVVYQIPMAD